MNEEMDYYYILLVLFIVYYLLDSCTEEYCPCSNRIQTAAVLADPDHTAGLGWIN